MAAIGFGQTRAIRVLMVVVGLVAAGACGPSDFEPSGGGGHGPATPLDTADLADAFGRLTQIQQRQASAGPAYAVRNTTTTPNTSNPAHGLTATFAADATHIAHHQQHISLTWTGIGRAALSDVGAATGTAAVHGNEVRLHHREGLEQWFVNGPLGLEQGFTVEERPTGAGALVLQVTVDGALPQLAGTEVRLLTGDARPLHYSDLFAEDAEGALLPAHFEVEGQHIALVIDDAAAVYPVRIDPLVWSEDDKLTASDAQASDTFGWSVAVSGDRAIVGANAEAGGSGDPAPAAGAAYVFERDAGGSWNEVAILRASDAQAGDAFGRAVALSGDRAIVGAFAEDGGAGSPLVQSGAAYVFERDAGGSWNETATLHASDAQLSDNFGWSVAISGDRAVVGAIGEDGGAGDPEANAGAAYVFEREGGGSWNEVTTLRASDVQAADGFGYAVAISGDYTIVNAPGEDGGSGDPIDFSGAAYVFERDLGGSWNEVAILRASDAQPSDDFGASVAISGGLAIVSAPLEDGGAGDLIGQAGAAYVFERNMGGTWNEVAILRASDAQADDHFGTSVAILGDRALVGAHNEDGGAGDPLSDVGAAYLFERDMGGTWNEIEVLRASDAQAGVTLGRSVALGADLAIVGAPLATGGSGDLVSSAGAAYVFVGREDCSNGVDDDGDGAADCDDVDCDGRACNDGNDCTTGELCSFATTSCGGGTNEPAATSCDDGLHCNGTDTCDAAGACANHTGDPCSAGDGAFCNGAEACNETTDACESPGDPCADDGLFCNGAESCNETTDACETTGDPCPDDGLYCTGVESCNDTTDACEATGDPCAANVGDADIDCSESCDDTTDSCEANDPPGSSCTDSTSTGTCDATGTCLFAQGEVCADNSACLSGFCVDGFCCDGSCDGICERCNRADALGTCSPQPLGTACRATALECDATEFCDGASRECPADVFAPNGTTCATGVCTDGECIGSAGGAGGSNSGNGGSGGDDATGGSGATDTGSGNSGTVSTPTPPQDEGCSCTLPGRQPPSGHAPWPLALALGIATTRRRSRRRPAHRKQQ